MKTILKLVVATFLLIGSYAANAQKSKYFVKDGVHYRDTCQTKKTGTDGKLQFKKKHENKSVPKNIKPAQKKDPKKQPVINNVKKTKMAENEYVDTTDVQSGAGIAIGKIAMRNDYKGSGMQECFLAPVHGQDINCGKMSIKKDSTFLRQRHFIFDTADSLGLLLYLSVKQFEAESQNSTITVSGILVKRESPEAERIKEHAVTGVSNYYDSQIYPLIGDIDELRSYVERYQDVINSDSVKRSLQREYERNQGELSQLQADTARLEKEKRKQIAAISRYIDIVIKRGVYLADNVIKTNPIDPGDVTTGSKVKPCKNCGDNENGNGYAGGQYRAKQRCDYCKCYVAPGTLCPYNFGQGGERRCHSFDCQQLPTQMQQACSQPAQQPQVIVVKTGRQNCDNGSYVRCGNCHSSYIFGGPHSCYGSTIQAGSNYSGVQTNFGWSVNAGGYYESRPSCWGRGYYQNNRGDAVIYDNRGQY